MVNSKAGIDTQICINFIDMDSSWSLMLNVKLNEVDM